MCMFAYTHFWWTTECNNERDTWGTFSQRGPANYQHNFSFHATRFVAKLTTGRAECMHVKTEKTCYQPYAPPHWVHFVYLKVPWSSSIHYPKLFYCWNVRIQHTTFNLIHLLTLVYLLCHNLNQFNMCTDMIYYAGETSHCYAEYCHVTERRNISGNLCGRFQKVKMNKTGPNELVWVTGVGSKLCIYDFSILTVAAGSFIKNGSLPNSAKRLQTERLIHATWLSTAKLTSIWQNKITPSYVSVCARL